MAKTTQAPAVRGTCTPEQPGGNVIQFRRKTAQAPAALSARADKGRKEALDDVFDALGQLTAAFNRYPDRSAVESAAVGEKLASVMKSALKLQFGGAA